MTIHYVDTAAAPGGDGSLSTPWDTIADVNGHTFAAGDSCLFKCGCTWRETLTPGQDGSVGNNITFGSYSTGAKPKIYGSTQVSTWSDQGSNHWSATCTATPNNIWFISSGGTITTGDKKTYVDLSELVNEFDWCKNGNTLYVYSTTDPDDAYASIEAGTRDYCVSGGVDYITIDGLYIAFANIAGITHTKWVDEAEGSTPGWVVQNCDFMKCCTHLYGPNTIVQDNTYTGPQYQTANYAAGCIFKGAVAQDCQVLRNTISGYVSRGIWFVREAGHGAIVNDNVVHDIAKMGAEPESFGIDLDGAGEPITGTVTITGNTVYNTLVTGIMLENCSGGSTVSQNLLYAIGTEAGSAAIFYINYDTGIYGDYADQRGNDISAQISYNIVYHSLTGVKLVNVSGVDIWNNVIYDGLGTSPTGLTIDDNGTYFVDTIDFRNNIVGSGMNCVASTEFAKEHHFSAFDYNCVDNDVIVEREPWDSLSLAELQAESYALNCFLTDPAFVDATNHNFRITATSPCKDTGVNVGLTMDYFGGVVPRGAGVDIGAHEFATNEVLKRYTGSAWVKAKLNDREGVAWSQRPLKRWSGTEWIDVDALGG